MHSDSDSDQFYECDDNFNLADGDTETSHLDKNRKADKFEESDLDRAANDNLNTKVPKQKDCNSHNNNNRNVNFPTKDNECEVSEDESNRNIPSTCTSEGSIPTTSASTQSTGSIQSTSDTFTDALSKTTSQIETDKRNRSVEERPKQKPKTRKHTTENLWGEPDNCDVVHPSFEKDSKGHTSDDESSRNIPSISSSENSVAKDSQSTDSIKSTSDRFTDSESVTRTSTSEIDHTKETTEKRNRIIEERPKEKPKNTKTTTRGEENSMSVASQKIRSVENEDHTSVESSRSIPEISPSLITKKTTLEEESLWDEGDNWDVDNHETSSKKRESSESEDNLWTEDDNWDIGETVAHRERSEKKNELHNALAALTNKEETSWGGWGNWLQAATSITTSVSQGLTNVIGIPDPEELAKQHKKQAQSYDRGSDDLGENPSQQSVNTAETAASFGLGIGNLVSGVSTITKLVETTGSKVISGGLGTLETIGKKTYEVLQDNDPQLRKKRAFLKQLEREKPVLSQILREAKERAEQENKERARVQIAKKANYETMFDDYDGLVHLEALEMLSKECDIKLQKMLREADDVEDAKETMDQIKDLCELANDDDDDESDQNEDEFKERIEMAVKEVNVPINFDKLLCTFDAVSDWIHSNGSLKTNQLHAHAIEHLAQITAMAVEQYHKAGEYLLIKEHRSTADEADNLVQLTMGLTGLISVLSTQYTQKMKDLENSCEADIRDCISNVFLEAGNSSRYIQDAFKLLIPVIQVGAL